MELDLYSDAGLWSLNPRQLHGLYLHFPPTSLSMLPRKQNNYRKTSQKDASEGQVADMFRAAGKLAIKVSGPAV